MRHAVGARRIIEKIQVSVGRGGYPIRGVRTILRRMTPKLKANNVDAIEGINEEKIFPARSSPSVIGVASSGSKLLLFFSPTMLYDAIIVGSVAGTMMKIMSTMLSIMGRTE